MIIFKSYLRKRKQILLVLASLVILMTISIWTKVYSAGASAIGFAWKADHLNGAEEKGRQKKHLVLFIAVLNKITAIGRRSAVRETWMTLCDSFDGRVACKFFTDTLEDLPQVQQQSIRNEAHEHKDMLFMPLKGSTNFSLRLIWMLKWVKDNYVFDFFLRIDDDQFLCLDRLVGELRFRPKTSLYWGFIHCYPKIVRVDEGWMVLTQDLVEEALSKLNSSLPCHPFADQAVAVWMIDSKYNVTYFYDNKRLDHHATAYQEANFLGPDICEKYLSLHGSYPENMRKYWNATYKNELDVKQYEVLGIPRYEDKCRHSNKIFDVNSFLPPYRHQLKPCKGIPTWETVEDFQSREKSVQLR